MTRPSPPTGLAPPRIAVVGGGLAGLAAAAGLAGRGFGVELFETRRRLGGRARSWTDPSTGELLDRCRHVALGCCTNFLDFCRRLGLVEHFRRDRRLLFIGPDGRRCDLAPGRLPAPLHLLGGLWRQTYLGPAERLGIARALGQLGRTPPRSGWEGPTLAAWLRERGQSRRAVELFWTPVVLGALGDLPDRVALGAARKVFVEGFLAAGEAGDLFVPTLPLAGLFDARASRWLAERGVTVHRLSRVRRIEADPEGRAAVAVHAGAGPPAVFDQVIAAVPWHRLRRLFDPRLWESLPGLARVEEIPRGAITAVHLWFDRPILDAPHAVLVGRLAQWVFQHEANRCEVVISGSHSLAIGKPEDLIERVRGELVEALPAARGARLIRGQVVSEPAAVFVLRPDVESLRPGPLVPVANLVLAGDWTATGWPATMESAVRSGYRAAEVVLERIGQSVRLVVDNLPRPPLARLLLAAR